MALIECPECSANVSDKASACPHCGYPLRGGSPTGAVTANSAAAITTPVVSAIVPPLADPEVVPLELTMGKVLRRHVVVSGESITVGGTTLALSEVVSLRWGTLVEKMQIGFMPPGTFATHRTIWVKTATDSLKIACSEARVLQPVGYGDQWIHAQHAYDALKWRLWWHCGVPLTLRFVQRIFSGEVLSIGDVDLTRDGALVKSRLLVDTFSPKQLIPWRDIASVEHSMAVLESKMRILSPVKILKDDNAPILAAIVELIGLLHDYALKSGDGNLATGMLQQLPNLWERREYRQDRWMGLLPNW